MVAPYIADEVKHPFVNTAPVALDVFDHAAATTNASRLEIFSAVSASELTEELDGAAEWLGVQIEEILLAALGRTFGRTRGDGAVGVDVTGGHRWLCHPVTLLCAASWPMGPTEMLQGAHTALKTASGRPAAQSEILLNVSPAHDDAAGGRALELRVRRADGLLHFDWLYDPARLDAYSVEEMAEQFPLALVEITSDAGAPL
ncbi:hypothetical protein Mycch_2491 [Mycolicibacterium chubuense NBB4]|uniref:Uncharacterized protein n=1 Tax=Mycolicibacterium chubuense (strain NBB4) TaxID=710421 RepID=I4BJ07_MYCCN|nr:hypothetical protein [Mycolicibacterium chubuense]AFM17264.1 hypothetical protein Mycch_2491 [Mycolicibacterium chubuense NBB4]